MLLDWMNDVQEDCNILKEIAWKRD